MPIPWNVLNRPVTISPEEDGASVLVAAYNDCLESHKRGTSAMRWTNLEGGGVLKAIPMYSKIISLAPLPRRSCRTRWSAVN